MRTLKVVEDSLAGGQRYESRLILVRSDQHVLWVSNGPRSMSSSTVFGRVVDAADLLCVTNIGGRIFAVDNHCPHARWPIAQGWVGGEEIVCPGHGMLFNVPNSTTA